MTRKNKLITASVIFLLSALLFFGMTMPFRVWLEAAEITEMRPVTALTPVLGLIFGLPAAIGCAVGNITADLISGYELSYALLNGAQQIFYGLLAYVLWRRLNKEHDGSEFCLDSISRLLKLFLVMAVTAAVNVLISAIINHVYSVTDLITINSLYTFVNVFDSGIIFGCPMLIAGHLLQRKLYNISHGKKEKVIVFSLNERMILNAIITGLGICVMIGASVYITEKIGTDENAIGLWGRIYLFQTIALNLYFALSMGFMWFSERKISRPVEQLAQVARGYYTEHSDGGEKEKLVNVCRQYESENTEVGTLARSYIAMMKDIDGYIENLRKATAEKERI
ncbi:MAG: hypothetical protein ACI4JI_01065, partial [Ruminiclostridium sp.]